jgi:hypothetical protein
LASGSTSDGISLDIGRKILESKNLFDETGTHRQAALSMDLVLRLAAALSG